MVLTRNQLNNLLKEGAKRVGYVAGTAALGAASRGGGKARTKAKLERALKRRRIGKSKSAPAASMYKGSVRKFKKGGKLSRRQNVMKKFAKKVKKVLAYADGIGKVHHVSTAMYQQQNLDFWSHYDTDGILGAVTGGVGGQFLDFFTPARFKDAEAVCWNNKVLSDTSYLTTALSTPSTSNMPTGAPVKIISADAVFYFKNESQHATTLEMYICTPIGGKDPSNVMSFYDEWNLSYSNIDRTTNTPQYSPSPILVGSLASDVKHTNYTYELRKIEMNPGEEVYQKIKYRGPKIVDPTKRWLVPSSGLSTPNWRDSYSKGCGIQVSFRMLNKLSIDGSSGGAHHFKNFATTPNKGGIIMEVTRNYVMGQPNSDVAELYKVPTIGFTQTFIGSANNEEQVFPGNPAVNPSGQVE